MTKTLLILLTCVVLTFSEVRRRNVVIIIADDMGWNDVSFHGSDQIPTPNIDLLATTGVALQRYYSPCVCTPSRAALLTGKFPHKIGMHGYPLTNGEARGLPISEKLLPQYLKELGYSTHLVGKWHVGHHRFSYLPTFRGYDSHFGHRGGFIDYYEYTAEETWVSGKVSGLDLYRNVTPAWDAAGYVTDLYNQEAIDIIEAHDESKPLFLTVAHSAPHAGNEGVLLQADPGEVRRMRHVESPQRRIYAAMVKKLDDSVGDIVTALHEKRILNDTIIIFISDNGGPATGETINWSSNVPHRGSKMTPWEGGIRVVGLIWDASINFTNNVWKGHIHTVDLLPTVLGAIEADIPKDIDGINLWENIKDDKVSDRDIIVEVYESETNNFSTVIQGDYKLVTSDNELDSSGYYGSDLKGIIEPAPSILDKIRESKVYKVLSAKHMGLDRLYEELRNRTKVNCGNVEPIDCLPRKGTFCLYNLKEDPCERRDLSQTLPDIVNKLQTILQTHINATVHREWPIVRKPSAAPKLFNYTWSSFDEPTL